MLLFPANKIFNFISEFNSLRIKKMQHNCSDRIRRHTEQSKKLNDCLEKRKESEQPELTLAQKFLANSVK